MHTGRKIILFILFAVVFNDSFSGELVMMGIRNYSVDKNKKEKKAADAEEGASAKGNFAFQPTLNFGHHTGFKKIYSSYGYGYTYTGLIPGVTINLDYNVHHYVSVGVYYSVGFQKFSKTNVFYLGNAFGARTTFHWWQLLADKSKGRLLADKIDFDIHVHAGGFLLAEKNKITGEKIKQAGFNAGGGLGFKYYFVKNFGVALDVGYEEASWLKIGLVFKV